MTRGTRIFMLAAGIVLATLVGYYGFYLEKAAEPGEAATADRVGSPAEPIAPAALRDGEQVGEQAGERERTQGDATPGRVDDAAERASGPVVSPPPRTAISDPLHRRQSERLPIRGSSSGDHRSGPAEKPSASQGGERIAPAANRSSASGGASGVTVSPLISPLGVNAADERKIDPPVTAPRQTPPSLAQPRPNTPARVSTPPAAIRPTTWTIRRGDSLYRIAELTLRNGSAWRRILSANPGLDPDALRIGQVLTIPARRAGRPPIGDPIPAGSHEVVDGENLSDIAKRYYGDPTRWREIYAANRSIISNGPDSLKIGMRLRIPKSGSRSSRK